jgi:hypothetical protein
MMGPRLQHCLLLILLLTLAACKHPLEIDGQGDIVERNNGYRGCSLEEFEGGFTRCTHNEVFEDETVIYQALPRAGWSFSHWDGACAKNSPEPDCKLEYNGAVAKLLDDDFPELVVPPLRAIFVEDSDAIAASYLTAASFGITNSATYASLLDAMFSLNGSYRYTDLVASTRSSFDRLPRAFTTQADGLLLVANEAGHLQAGGATTATADLLTLVDTDPSDGEISVTYLMPKRTDGQAAEFVGTYYCGHIATGGLARFVKIIAAGNGGGVYSLLSDRAGRFRQAAVSYQVSPSGTMTLDYSNVHLVGSLSAGGAVFTSSQLQSSAHGAAICIRASANNTLANAEGSWIGSWMSTGPNTAVTELLIVRSGQTAEAVHIDSNGGRNYSLGSDWMLVNWDGRLETSIQNGAISADSRIAFTVNTDPSKYPTLIVYIRKRD